MRVPCPGSALLPCPHPPALPPCQTAWDVVGSWPMAATLGHEDAIRWTRRWPIGSDGGQVVPTKNVPHGTLPLAWWDGSMRARDNYVTSLHALKSFSFCTPRLGEGEELRRILWWGVMTCPCLCWRQHWTPWGQPAYDCDRAANVIIFVNEVRKTAADREDSLSVAILFPLHLPFSFDPRCKDRSFSPDILQLFMQCTNGECVLCPLRVAGSALIGMHCDGERSVWWVPLIANALRCRGLGWGVFPTKGTRQWGALPMCSKGPWGLLPIFIPSCREYCFS
jgi:hypothetical protein